MMRTPFPTSLVCHCSTILAVVFLCLGSAGALHADESMGGHADHHAGGKGMGSGMAGDGEAYIQYRQAVMSGIGANMGAISAILKNRLAMPGHVAIHATLMADSAQLIGPAFEKKVTEGPTDAKAEIWEDWEDFEKDIAEFEKAARNLATAASGKDPAAIGPAVKALGKSCGGCHKEFRKPKEESYKNASH